MDRVEVPQPSAHGIHVQQDTKKEVEVLHMRHHVCMWKIRRNHGTHVQCSKLTHPCPLYDIITLTDLWKQFVELWKGNEWCDDTTMIIVVSKVRDLGVVFDQYLTFYDQISDICKSTHFHLRGMGRIRNLLTFDATTQLIHALITSRLDFCNSILYNLPNKQIERLQRIQNQSCIG